MTQGDRLMYRSRGCSIESSTTEKDTAMTGSTDSDWVLSVKNELDHLSKARKTRAKCTMFRVPPPLRQVKPEDFTPRLISFGLFDRNLVQAPRIDTYRLEVASAFLESLDMTTADWDKVCARVVSKPEEMQELYDGCPIMPSDVVQCLLTLDAIFLASLFSIGLVTTDKFPLLESVLFQEGALSHVIGYLQVDVILLENQIPLSLIRNVLEILYGIDRVGADGMLTTLCKETIIKYSRSGSIPGSDRLYTYMESVVEKISGSSLVNCQHLLECLYKGLCHGAEDDSDMWLEDKGTYVSLPGTVTQLQAAGIKFKGGARGISDVEFKPGWFTATLYLPKLALDATTEQIWRNLVAYESVTTDRHHFMCYLELMDDLIETHKDVGLLRKGKDPVISQNSLGPDKDVAALFNSMLQNCSTKRSQKYWTQLRRDISAHYNKKYIKLYVECREKFFAKPWAFISVVAATVLLVLTTLQTVYTMLGYHPQHTNSPAPSPR